MKNKEELVAAVKNSWMYIVVFALMLIILPMFRGEKLEFIALRIVLLLGGSAVVIFMRYQRLMIDKRNRELGYTAKFDEKGRRVVELSAEPAPQEEENIPEDKE